MRECGFSLTRILPYKDRIYDSVLIRENTGQWKPVFSHILCSDIVSQSGCAKNIKLPANININGYKLPNYLFSCKYFLKTFWFQRIQMYIKKTISY